MNQPFPESFTLRSGRSISLTADEANELFDMLVRSRFVVGTAVPVLPAFTAPLPLTNPWPPNPAWYIDDVSSEVKFTQG